MARGDMRRPVVPSPEEVARARAQRERTDAAAERIEALLGLGPETIATLWVACAPGRGPGRCVAGHDPSYVSAPLPRGPALWRVRLPWVRVHGRLGPDLTWRHQHGILKVEGRAGRRAW